MPGKADSDSVVAPTVTSPSDAEERNHVKKSTIDGSQTRWIVISLVVYFFLAEGFSKTCFGQVDNIVSLLFNVSMEKVDWLTLTPSTSSAPTIFIMTWIIASGFVGLRKWCLTSAIVITLSFFFIVIAVIHRHLFAVAIFGQILSGMASGINFSLVPLVAASWFPNNERPVAIALTYAGLNAGNIIGILIPNHMLPTIHDSLDNIGPKTDGSKVVSITLTAIFSSFLASSVLFGFITFLFVFDSPSPMQLAKSISSESTNQGGYEMRKHDGNKRKESVFLTKMNHAKDLTRSTASAWFHASKTLLTNGKFMSLAVSHGIIMPLCLPWFVLMPAFILHSTQINNIALFDTTFNATSQGQIGKPLANEIAGYIMSMYCAGGLVAGLLTGKVAQLMRFRYECLACIAAWVAVAASLGLFVSFTYGTIEGIFAFMFLFGLCVPAVATALVVLVIDHVRTIDRLTVGAWLAIFSAAGASLLTLFGKILVHNFGLVSMHVFQLSLTTIVAAFLTFVRRYFR